MHAVTFYEIDVDAQYQKECRKDYEDLRCLDGDLRSGANCLQVPPFPQPFSRLGMLALASSRDVEEQHRAEFERYLQAVERSGTEARLALERHLTESDAGGLPSEIDKAVVGHSVHVESVQRLGNSAWYNIIVMRITRWRCYKRYSEFKVFDKRLRQHIQKLPALPGAGLVGLRHKMDMQGFEEKRQSGLQDYLEACTQFADGRPVLEFLWPNALPDALSVSVSDTTSYGSMLVDSGLSPSTSRASSPSKAAQLRDNATFRQAQDASSLGLEVPGSPSRWPKAAAHRAGASAKSVTFTVNPGQRAWREEAAPCDRSVGERVNVGPPFSQKAVIRFIGSTQFQYGTWLGLELDTPSGKNDGAVQGIRYFRCKPQHGLFVQPACVKPEHTRRRARGVLRRLGRICDTCCNRNEAREVV